MPRVQRSNPPRPLFALLLDLIRTRNISPGHLGSLAELLDTEPEVPNGKWFKKFSGMPVCGEDELIETFFRPGQAAVGEKVN